MAGRRYGDDNYSIKYIEKVDEYLKKHKDRPVKMIKAINEDKGTKVYENKLRVKLPTIEGFGRYVGKPQSTLQSWAKKYPEFRDALDLIKEIQKERLINMGLSGDYNSAITGLILSTNHNMVRRTDTTSNGQSLGAFSDEQITRIADRVARRRGDDGSASGEEKLD